MSQVEKVCAQCNHEFWSKGSSNRKYCSQECSVLGNGALVHNIICGICQTEFEVRGKKKKYCSDKCVAASRNLSRTSKLRVERVMKPCEACGAEVWRRPKDHRQHTFCNRKCSNLRMPMVMAQRGTGELAEQYKIVMGVKVSWRPTADGYISLYVPDPDQNKRGRRILEHRYIMERILGRPLKKTENVHHLDATRNNNDPKNLELWVKPQPVGVRLVDNIKQAQEFLAQYGKVEFTPNAETLNVLR